MNTAPETDTAAIAKEPAKTAKPAKPVPAVKKATAPAASADGKASKSKATKAPLAPAPTTAAKRKEATAKETPAKAAKAKKPKLVRDSFTIPKDEYSAIEALKLRAVGLAHPVKKSELLRAGLKLLSGLSDTALRAALQAVPPIKTGRPTKDVEATPVKLPPAAKAPAKTAKTAAKAQTK